MDLKEISVALRQGDLEQVLRSNTEKGDLVQTGGSNLREEDPITAKEILYLAKKNLFHGREILSDSGGIKSRGGKSFPWEGRPWPYSKRDFDAGRWILFPGKGI